MGGHHVGSRLRPRVHLAWVLVVMWGGSVAYYWWNHVPALPQAVIPVPADRSYVGFDADGNVVLAHRHYVGKEVQAWFETGPIEVISSSDGSVLKTLGEATDDLVCAPEGGSHIVMQSGDKVLVIHIPSKRAVLTIPVPAARATAMFSMDEKRVAVAAGNVVSMHAIGTGEQVWRREFQLEDLTEDRPPPSEPAVVQMEVLNGEDATLGEVLGIGWGIVDPRKPERRNQYSTEELWLSSTTGERDSRFEGATGVVESRQGQYAIVEYFAELPDQKGWQEARLKICALADGRDLWRIPDEVLGPEFSPDGKEIWTFSDVAGRPSLSRRRVSDGVRISTTPEEPGGLTALVDPTMSWLVAEMHHEAVLAPAFLVSAVAKLGITWNGLIEPAGRHLVRTRIDGSRPLTLIRQIDYEGAFYREWLHSLGRQDHFAVVTPKQITIYSFEPPRNWWWLAGWGLGPVVVVMAGFRWRAHRRGTLHGNI